MRAIVLEAFGPPDVLQLRSLPDPEPGPGEALVRIAACGVNRRDAWVRRRAPKQGAAAHPWLRHRRDDRGDRPGSRCRSRRQCDVVVYPVLSCERCSSCAAGDSHLCASAGLLGAEVDGGYCELIALDEGRVLPAPPALDLTQAAALPIVYTTAWQMLRRTRLGPGG